MKIGRSYSLEQERLTVERQQSIIRILLSLTTSLLLIKFYAVDQAPLPDPKTVDVKSMDYLLLKAAHVTLPHVITIVALFMVYSLTIWALLKWIPNLLKPVAVASSVIEIVLITFLMNSPAAPNIPFYFWYIFYVACVATRYGWKFSIFALSASLLSYYVTLITFQHGYAAQFPTALGYMVFLMVLAFLFGQISDRQLTYQASLGIVNEFRADLTSIATSGEIINHLLNRVKELLRVEEAWFLPADRGSDGSEAPGLRSAGADPVLMSTFREGGDAWNVARVLELRCPIMSNNPLTDPSFPKGMAAKLGLKNIIAAPLMVRSIQVGVIYAANRKDDRLHSADLQFLGLMAAQTAPVVENAILWERLRESAALEERARIARDLHDSFLQTLAAIKIHLERCKVIMQKDTGRALEGIEKIHDIATRGLAEVRVYLSELRMFGPEPSRFKQAVEKCSADAAARAGFETHVEVHLPDEPIPPNIALSAFQVLRELLNNAANHSHAKHVQVRVFVEDGKLMLEIEDDGNGFDVENVRPEKASKGHIGLVGIEERLKQSRGGLVLVSEPGKGTRATAELSLIS